MLTDLLLRLASSYFGVGLIDQNQYFLVKLKYTSQTKTYIYLSKFLSFIGLVSNIEYVGTKSFLLCKTLKAADVISSFCHLKNLLVTSWVKAQIQIQNYLFN